ncbi:DivIVA domain-containing protein [Actinokineospora guangxiensis]|uniref:DivIVA domain-containing protein n=1 Tax=Actinokineospora guangxiensis TaxID=1490288 RepID=A0ABW0ELZ1_9PSEU
MADTEPGPVDGTTFDVVFRGFDRAQVTTFITALVERAERDQEALRAAEERAAGSAEEGAGHGGVVTKLGKAVEAIVLVAEKEAAALLATAEAEAREQRERAAADAAAIVAKAHDEAADVRRAHDEVLRTLTRVRGLLGHGAVEAPGPEPEAEDEESERPGSRERTRASGVPMARQRTPAPVEAAS